MKAPAEIEKNKPDVAQAGQYVFEKEINIGPCQKERKSGKKEQVPLTVSFYINFLKFILSKTVFTFYQNIILSSLQFVIMFRRTYFKQANIIGVCGPEVEGPPCNLEVPSSIPRSWCQLWDFFIGPHIQREYWFSSQEAE